MAKAYSIDLRERVVAFVAGGQSCHEAAARFRVSVSFVVKLMQAWRESGQVRPEPAGGRRHAKLEAHRALLLERVEARSDITMLELAAELRSATGVCATFATLAASQRLPLQKKLLANEQDRTDVWQARREWRDKRQPMMRLEAHRLVFIDETGTNTKMTRRCGRCLKGQRLRATAPFGHWMTQTFIAGLRCQGLIAPFVVDKPMNRRIFEAYVESQLAPTLAKGDVVILDNLPAHKSPTAEAAIKARGAWMLFLPPDSPDLNPIEMAFAKPALSEAEGLKAHLRRRAMRTIDALWRAIGDICGIFQPDECRNYFKAAGMCKLERPTL